MKQGGGEEGSSDSTGPSTSPIDSRTAVVRSPISDGPRSEDNLTSPGRLSSRAAGGGGARIKRSRMGLRDAAVRCLRELVQSPCIDGANGAAGALR